jgi:nucleoside-diphosphate-sugar epimerase
MITLVTGISGFVGQAVCARLLLDRVSVRGAVRAKGIKNYRFSTVTIDDISSKTDWTSALKDVSLVVHLAARVHVMDEKSADPLAEFRRVNVDGTVALARQAAGAGVRRFVFLSSVKVNGEFTKAGNPFTADDEPAPADYYGVSKHEAEQSLREIASETGMDVVIIRPPLVYGPGVRANFAAMIRWLEKGIPLPLAAATRNRRSLVALDNLVDLIVTCLTHPAAANQTFLVSDGEDLSTAELLQRLGKAFDKPVHLFFIPLVLLRMGARILMRPGIYQRLCGSLQLDITKNRQMLGWSPPISVEEGLKRVTHRYLS